MALRTLYINEKKLDNLYIGKDIQLPAFPVEVLQKDVTGGVGAVYSGRKVGTLDLTIPLTYNNTYKKYKYKDINDLLIKFLNHENEVSIRFSDEDWYYVGHIAGPIVIPKKVYPAVEFDLNIKLLRPFKYSVEKYSNKAVEDQVAVPNLGTAPLYPVIKAKALKDATYFMASKNDDDYIMMGEPPSATKKAKKVNPSVLTDRLESTAGWYYIGVSGDSVGDNETGGIVGATVKSNGYGLYVNKDTYPKTVDAWTGAGVKKNFSRTIKDFEHDFTIRVNEESEEINKIGTGKVFTHLWDEQGRMVAAVGLVDASKAKDDLTVIAKLYDETGEPQTIVRYKPSKDVYLDELVYIKVTRKGNKWTFKLNTIQSIKVNERFKNIAKKGAAVEIPRNVYTKTYTDKYKQYSQPVRATSIYIGQYNWPPPTVKNAKVTKNLNFTAGAYDIRTKELLPKKADEVDEFIEAGDIITIDCYNQKMLLNKGDASKYKDFGSNYFGLEPGNNEVFILPEGKFDTTVTWTQLDY